jgi:hypothetical protein
MRQSHHRPLVFVASLFLVLAPVELFAAPAARATATVTAQDASVNGTAIHYLGSIPRKAPKRDIVFRFPAPFEAHPRGLHIGRASRG